MQQRGIRHFFQSKQCRQAPAPVPYADQHHDEDATILKQGAQQSKPGLQQFSRKRRRTEETGGTPAASPPPLAQHNKQPSAAIAAPQQQQQQQPAAPAQKKPPSGGTTRQLTQMHLDVGQRDFHVGRCAVCGLVYSKGEERDEKTHAAYHANATKGLRYQALPNERVALLDGSGSRVVVVASGDTRSKKLQELCGFLEEQMGLVKGWLLSVPASLYLYVSPTKRILGCVVAEGIKEAFPVVPQLQPEVAAQLRSHGSAAAACSPQPAQRGNMAATSPPMGSRPAASITLSSRTACTAGEAVAAGQREAAGQLQGGGLQALGAAHITTAAAAAGHASAEADEACSAESSPEQAALQEPPPLQQGQQPSEQGQAAELPAGETDREAELLQAVQGSSEQCCSPEQRQEGQQVDLSPMPPQQQGSGGAQAMPEQLHKPAALSWPQAGAAATDAAQPPAAAPLAIDRRQRVRAVCGVRLVWVSTEARRRGIATRLLDCMRSQFMRGYVVPRHELAFTQPSDQGRALIEAYTSSRKFLVYY